MNSSWNWLRIASVAVACSFLLGPALSAEELSGESIRPLPFAFSTSAPETFSSLSREEKPATSTKQNEQIRSASGHSQTQIRTAQRETLRNRLAKDGLATAAGQDQLAAEVANVVKWTIAILVLGALALVGMKYFGVSVPKPTAAGNLRLVETLSLGRQHGLHLVELGKDRFVVAVDQQGIKSMTLMPSWPDLAAADASDLPESENPLQMTTEPTPRIHSFLERTAV